jgi:uncharacterized membrane protein YesL
MAGFFGFFDYSKPGPGVPKDGPPKARILVFFEILQRKFWNLVKVNMMFNIFNIPAIILGMLASMFLFQQILPGLNLNTAEDAIGDLVSRFVLLTVFLCIPLVTVGPAQAGYTYVLRNYSREEHAFIWSDFKEHASKNFKQSLIVCGIDFLVTCFMLLALKFYFLMNNNNLLFTIATTLMIMVLVIFMIMHIYIYPMMVTFKLSTKQLYKNALLFSLAKLLPNIGILLLCILILFLTFGMLIPFNPIIGFILYAFITVSLIGMITNFYAYGKIEKYMMPSEEDEEEEYEEEEGEEEYEEEEDTAEEDEQEEEPVTYEEEDDRNPDDSSEYKRYY